ncbi:hypothetical protein BGZ80_007528, partial [Entomortierella chlamydospora]
DAIKDDSVILISSGDDTDEEEDYENDDEFRKFFGEPYGGTYEDYEEDYEEYYDDDGERYDGDRSDGSEDSLVVIIDDDDDDDEQEDIVKALKMSQSPRARKVKDADLEHYRDGLDSLTKSPTLAIRLSEEGFDVDISDEKPRDTPIQGLANKRSIRVRSESVDEDYDYNADYLLGGEIEAYQQEIERQGKRRALLSGNFRRPRIQHPATFTAQEMQIIFACVGEFTRALRQVDWDSVAREVAQSTGYQRSGNACLEAFERAIGQYSKVPLRCQTGLTTLHSKISMVNLLKMRESGIKQRQTFK